MSRSIARARAGRDRTSLYQEITDKIIAELEAGRVPWVQPWGTAAAKASLTMPKNAATHRHYSGLNVLILWCAVIERRFSTQNWLTFRQALGLGGNVRKGEHGTTVVYADHFVPDEERKRAERDGDEPSGIRFLKRFTVFNTDQCEDLPPEVVSAPSPVPEGLMVPQAEALIAATGADFRIGGDRAFYSPNYDFIQVPRPEAYFEPINWHRTALHELGHWTGAAQRLDRDLSGSFGSKKYAQEELVAEITSALVCASLGIVPTVRHSDYIGSWLEVLREDDRSIVRAASAASKAADYLLAFCPESNECVQGVESSNHLLVIDRQETCAWRGAEMPTASVAVLSSRAAVVAVTGHQARNRSVATRRGDTPMRMSDDPAPGDYDDYYIASILRSESTTFRLNQGILFTTWDALGYDTLENAISRTRQIDHWLASNFDGAIIFDEGDAVQHGTGEESECRAHDDLKAVPQTAGVGDKAVA